MTWRRQCHSIIGWCATTPQDYPETTGFGRQTEREWVTGAAAPVYSRGPIHAHLHHWQRRNHAGRGAAADDRHGGDCRCFAGRVARRPAQRQAPAGAVERAPGAEKQTKVGDRNTLIDRLWTAIEALPDPEQQSD